MSASNCDEHGWWEGDGWTTCPACEITTLRAELLSAREALRDMIDHHMIACEFSTNECPDCIAARLVLAPSPKEPKP